MFSWATAQPLEVTGRIAADRVVYFVSDLHLGDGTRSDTFHGKDRELIALLDRVREDDALLVIAGDAIDLQQAFSISRVLKAHARLFGELSRLADQGRVWYLWGNHDYDISLFRDLLRFHVASSLWIGDDILVEHGYQYDRHIGSDLAGTHVATVVHHLIERALNSWLRLPIEQFYTRPVRVAFWLFHKYAHAVHLLDRAWRSVGRPDKMARALEAVTYWTQSQLGDSSMLWDGVARALPGARARVLVAGHSHLPGQVALGDKRFINTGSWTFASAQYARFDGGAFEVRDWITGRTYGDEYYQDLMQGRYAHMSFFDWWRENYLGWFRYRIAEEGRLPALPAAGG
jgi:UDP-2,3-diacylglucosamine pyrophosphatase LpxH